MTSNIKVRRICEFCSKEFTARTTVTKHCSDLCAKRAYKKREREKKIENSNKETVQKLSIPVERIKANDYLTFSEAATLIRVSRSSLYRIIWSGSLKVIKIKSKTIVAKKDLDEFLKWSVQSPPSKKTIPTEETELMSFGEIRSLYEISDTTLYSMVKRKQITKRKIMGTNYVPKSEILKLLGNPKK
jgi:excisionase family DNA binding protein